jgi:hypothetical protein
MDRRQVLKLGAALTTLPLTGCGANTLPPRPAPAAGPGAPTGGKAAAAAPDTEAAAADGAPAREDEGAGAPARGGEGAGAPAAPAEDEAPESSFTRVVARVGRNHGHVLTVSLADVMAGAEKTYDLTGTAKHPHSVTLSADDMKRLLEGKIVRSRSTTQGHAHNVVVRCAPPVDPPEWVNVCKFSSSGQDEHEIVITAADMDAKVEKTYDLQGLAGHAHQVTLTTADFEKLLKGGPVTRRTTRDPDDAHLHTVTIEYPLKKTKT